MTQNTQQVATALVLGATGGIGGAVTGALLSRGWQVRALTRRAPQEMARKRPEISWVSGDAMDADAVLAAAEGVCLIVHAVNPPGYRDWDKLSLPMLENTIAAARAVDARILFPGTIYNFGPDALPNLTEDSAQHPVTGKGAVRARMEKRLRAASATGVPVLIVRAGDYFGPNAANNWFGQLLVTPGKPVRSVTYPGRKGVGHQWAYLPDVAETMMRLVDRRAELPDFAEFQMEGFWDADGTQLIAAIGRAVGAPPRVKSFPWWLLPLAAPFVPFFRELREIRYLWQMPVRMRNDRLVAFLGQEPRTPLDEAMRTTLTALDCLPPAPPAHAGRQPSLRLPA